MTRQQAVNFLLKSPYKLGHLLGFTKLTELHNEWIVDMIKGKEDETLQSHRGSFKTTCVSIALAIICVLLPNCRILFMRKTDTDVKEIIAQVQKILESQQMKYFVQCIYDVELKLTTRTATEVATNLTTDTKGTAQLVGKGIGGSLTGKHFDKIFTDDIVNLEDRISRAERDKTKSIYQELQNIKNRGGRIYNTGTAWHKDDAFVLMPNPKKYDCYSTGLIDEIELAEIKDKMAPSLFSANYELKHIASEDVIFADAQTGAERYLAEQGDCHVDAAYGGEDYTAFTICKKSNGKYYVFGKLWQKHVDFCKDEIKNYVADFNTGKLMCETNGDKGYLAKEFKRMGLRSIPYHEDTNKYIKIVTYLKAEWRNVIFVEGTDAEYIEQVLDYNENAEHDDAPDSLASMIRKLWKKGNSGGNEYKSILR